jgi:LacI family transcriptional regulator
MVTIKEVARKAGVSTATVSYVLNDARKVRPETQKRVLVAARRLGYTPNTAARSLAAGRSSTLGLVVPDIGNPFFPEIIRAFQESANCSGLEAVVMNTGYDAQRTRGIIERLVGLQVPGAAFFTTQVDSAIKEALAARNIAAVYMDDGQPAGGISSIAINYRQGMLEAIAHLRDLGHQRIGLIGGPSLGAASQRRKTAFLEGLETHGLEGRAIDSDFSVQGGYFSCSKLLASYDCTAVIAANDLMAIGALHLAYDRQIAVPARLSIIGFDDINFARFTQPALTTVAVPRTEIGTVAFESLSALMRKPGAAGEIYEIPTHLVVRQTTAGVEEA